MSWVRLKVMSSVIVGCLTIVRCYSSCYSIFIRYPLRADFKGHSRRQTEEETGFAGGADGDGVGRLVHLNRGEAGAGSPCRAAAAQSAGR